MSQFDFMPFIHDLATESGRAIAPFFRSGGVAQNKAAAGNFDPVTEGDRAGEAIMRRMINEKFSDHGIIGEEYGSERSDADYVWVLDPIDGTRSFVAGIPTWGTLIGLLYKGKPVLGMMHQSFTGERFFGDGKNAFYLGPDGERQLGTRQCDALSEATLFTSDPGMFKGRERDAYLNVESRVRLKRFSADCYAYCMLAAGHVDLVIETELKPHDIVALIPIVQGAGGVISSWGGEAATAGGAIIAASSSTIHAEALKLLS